MQIVNDVRNDWNSYYEMGTNIKVGDEEISIDNPCIGINEIDLYAMIYNNIDRRGLFLDLEEYHTKIKNGVTRKKTPLYWWRKEEKE